MTDHLTTQDTDISNERTLTFWMTLVVTTLIVGFAVYILSFAMLGPSGTLPSHRAASNSFITLS